MPDYRPTRKQVEEALKHREKHHAWADKNFATNRECCSLCPESWRTIASAARMLLGPVVGRKCSNCGIAPSREFHDDKTCDFGGTLIPLVAGLEEE